METADQIYKLCSDRACALNVKKTGFPASSVTTAEKVNNMTTVSL